MRCAKRGARHPRRGAGTRHEGDPASHGASRRRLAGAALRERYHVGSTTPALLHGRRSAPNSPRRRWRKLRQLAASSCRPGGGILDARMSTDGLDGAAGWLPKIPPAHQWPAPDATRSNLRPDEPDQLHRLRGPQSMARRASVVQTPCPSRRWPSALIAPRAAAFSTLIASAAHATSASMIRNTPPSRKLPGTWHLPFPPTPRIFTGGGPHDFGAADRI